MDVTALINLVNETRFYWLPALNLALLWLVVREVRRLLRAGRETS